MKKLIVVLVVLTLILGVFTPAMASVFQVPISKLNSQFNLGHYLQSGKIPPFLNVAEKISNGLMGKVVISSTGMASLFTWKPNSGKRDEYKWNGTSWEFIKTITGIVPGMEEPLSVVSNKETIWQEYAHILSLGDNGSSDFNVVVNDNGLHLTIDGKRLIEVGETDTITATVSGGTAPYTFAWNMGTPHTSGSSSMISRVWAMAGTYDVVVAVRDSVGNSVHGQISVTVVPRPSVTVSGPSELKVNQRGTYTAIVQGGIPPYHYRWGAGTVMGSSSESSITSSFGTPGVYVIAVTVTDSHNYSASGSKSVKVLSPLTVSISGPTSLYVGESATYVAHVSGGAPAYSYNWSSTLKGIIATGQGYNNNWWQRRYIQPISPSPYGSGYTSDGGYYSNLSHVEDNGIIRNTRTSHIGGHPLPSGGESGSGFDQPMGKGAIPISTPGSDGGYYGDPSLDYGIYDPISPYYEGGYGVYNGPNTNNSHGLGLIPSQSDGAEPYNLSHVEDNGIIYGNRQYGSYPSHPIPTVSPRSVYDNGGYVYNDKNGFTLDPNWNQKRYIQPVSPVPDPDSYSSSPTLQGVRNFSTGNNSTNMSWDTPGEYIVSVVVHDSVGQVASASLIVRVIENYRPTPPGPTPPGPTPPGPTPPGPTPPGPSNNSGQSDTQISFNPAIGGLGNGTAQGTLPDGTNVTYQNAPQHGASGKNVIPQDPNDSGSNGNGWDGSYPPTNSDGTIQGSDQNNNNGNNDGNTSTPTQPTSPSHGMAGIH